MSDCLERLIKQFGSYFHENENSATFTVNRDFHRIRITDFFVHAHHGIDVNDVWFQQDSVTSYTSHALINLLRGRFDDRLISRIGDVKYPPRRYDI